MNCSKLCHAKSPSRKAILHFEGKKLLKQCQKEVIYEYILAFAAWWSIFWKMVGSGGCVLAGGGWWWIYCGWGWVVVGGGGYILDGGEWWCVVVGCGEWWHSLV